MARVKISKTPKALSGLEVKMRPGLYGTNGNRQFTLPNQVNSQRFSQQPVDVRDTLQPVAREGANLEAEKGETALVNIDGIPAHFKIGGKRHSKGGTPLNLPDNSFIFSDTAKMKIKDPIVLAQFGMVPKKAGYTPAEIAKKYDINTFRKILADPNSEDVERKTAEAMITNYNMKLAKLALIQESMKGFPQGIPAVAMPYVMANEINPEELFETQGQEEQPDADMGVARYGGIPRAQKGLTHKDSIQHQVNKILKYEQLRGGSGSAPLSYYADPKYNTMLMDKILPEVNKIMPNASAMEKGEAMDFIINAGWDDAASKITKDPRAFALQEYYRKNDPSKLDADGKWAGRKGAPYSFDQEYEETIGNLSENERRIMMNKGRDWYYKNTAPKGSSWDLKTQGPHPNYKDTWYGRIWNTNDFNEFDPNNPKFTPKRYGGNMISQFNTKAYGGVQYNEDGLPMGQNGFDPTTLGGWGAGLLNVLEAPQRGMMWGLTGAAGLARGKGWTGQYEMPSETIHRNFPGHPFLEGAADILADPFLVSGVIKGVARSGLKKVLAKEAAEIAMKKGSSKLTQKEITNLAIKNAAAKSKAVTSGKKTVAQVTKLYKTDKNAKILNAAYDAARLATKTKKFKNAADLVKKATMVQNTAIKAAGRQAQKEAFGAVGRGAVYLAKKPIAVAKATGKYIAENAPEKIAAGAKYVKDKTVETVQKLADANVRPLILPATKVVGTVGSRLKSNDQIEEANTRAYELELANAALLEQLQAAKQRPTVKKAVGPRMTVQATGETTYEGMDDPKYDVIKKENARKQQKDVKLVEKPTVKTEKFEGVNVVKVPDDF